MKIASQEDRRYSQVFRGEFVRDVVGDVADCLMCWSRNDGIADVVLRLSVRRRTDHLRVSKNPVP